MIRCNAPGASILDWRGITCLYQIPENLKSLIIESVPEIMLIIESVPEIMFFAIFAPLRDSMLVINKPKYQPFVFHGVS